MVVEEVACLVVLCGMHGDEITYRCLTAMFIPKAVDMRIIYGGTVGH